MIAVDIFSARFVNVVRYVLIKFYKLQENERKTLEIFRIFVNFSTRGFAKKKKISYEETLLPSSQRQELVILPFCMPVVRESYKKDLWDDPLHTRPRTSKAHSEFPGGYLLAFG